MEEHKTTAVTLGAPTALGYVDPAAVAAAEKAKALVQAAYMVALARPRNFDQARVRILDACRRPSFADRVEYSKPQGNKFISGPTIRFAELAIREYGNIRTDTSIVFEDDRMRRILITVVDLQTNATFSRETSVRKQVERHNKEGREVLGERINKEGKRVYIVVATEDEMLQKESSAVSRAIRNEGLRLIPRDLIDEAIDEARKTVADHDAKDPDASKLKLVDSFARLGIDPVELEKFLGHGLSTTTEKDLKDLRGAYGSIREGETTWAQVMGAKAEEQPAPPPKEPIKPPKVVRMKKDRRGDKKKPAPKDAGSWDGVNARIEEAAKAEGLTIEDIAIFAAKVYEITDLTEMTGLDVVALLESITKDGAATILSVTGGTK